MRPRLSRFVRSRRVRAGTLAAVGLMTLGSCGGALLANYTVAGMNPVYVARADRADPLPRRSAAAWMAEEAFRSVEHRPGAAEFADPWDAEPIDASY